MSLDGPRQRAAKRGTARTRIWDELPARGNGVSVAELEGRGLGSAVSIRRALRCWTDAGYLQRTEVDGENRFRLLAGAPKIAPMILATFEVVEAAPAMSPDEFAAIRRRAGLSVIGMARAIGWTGHVTGASRAMRRFEDGDRPIDAALAAKVRAIAAK